MEDVNCSLNGGGDSCYDDEGWHYESCVTNCPADWLHPRNPEGCINPTVYCAERNGTPVTYNCPSCMECYEEYGGHCSPIYSRDKRNALTYDTCTAPNGKTFYCATSCPEGWHVYNCECVNF